MDQLLNTVPVKVTIDKNGALLKPFSTDEIKSALFQMFPTTAPGPDGFPAHFFQHHWNNRGEEVATVVLRVLNGEHDPALINDTRGTWTILADQPM